ncbi:MAG: YjbH domain-containing protein [Parachlamydiales bacterium]|nr:YjbH domain-containing protein [Parachlamydiales bacterium]
MFWKLWVMILCGFYWLPGYGEWSTDLENDLRILSHGEKKLPLLYNSSSQTGYFTMPSARSLGNGLIIGGYSHIPPYKLWGVGIGLFECLELSGNYWVYNGIVEKNFGHLGFGNDAERSVNIKIVLPLRYYGLPSVAFGWNDFLGTKRFFSQYAAVTQEFLSQRCEVTLGWGKGRIQGLFGGLAYFPWRKSDSIWKGLGGALEYDGNDYAHHIEEHPQGKKTRFSWNPGLFYTWKKRFQCAGYLIRGKEIAATVSLNYPWGTTKGFFSKVRDSSRNDAEIEEDHSGKIFFELWEERIKNSLYKEGFWVDHIGYKKNLQGSKEIIIYVKNPHYRHEKEVHKKLIGSLQRIPDSSEVFSISVVVQSSGLETFQYTFPSEVLEAYRENRMSEYELEWVTSPRDCCRQGYYIDLWRRKDQEHHMAIHPLINMYFGSSRGKFKYDLGTTFGFEGVAPYRVYYELYGAYVARSSTADISHTDFLNPSRLLWVRSDTLQYYKQGSLELDRFFVQKSRNWGKGFFSRIGIGYFERAYGGAGAELLYAPYSSRWAIGTEAFFLKKRRYHGLGFYSKIPKLDDKKEQRIPYLGTQFFLHGYFVFPVIETDVKISVGQFLAKDIGARVEFLKHYRSGVRFSLWTTMTNGQDRINGKKYYDKGFSFSFPLDLFLHKSNRSRVSYVASVWLRDVGAVAQTGKDLYTILFQEKEE